MKWIQDHMETYINAKEYIDTIIIPTIPFQLSQETDVKKSAFMNETMNIFVHEIEKELSGRVMLVPNYHYLKQADKETEVIRLNEWVKDIQTQPFNHIFFITFDPTWRKVEKDLHGNLVWLPGFQLGNIHSSEMHNMIHSQVEQICELIRSYW